jgi:hypothetical protein
VIARRHPGGVRPSERTGGKVRDVSTIPSIPTMLEIADFSGQGYFL